MSVSKNPGQTRSRPWLRNELQEGIYQACLWILRVRNVNLYSRQVETERACETSLVKLKLIRDTVAKLCVSVLQVDNREHTRAWVPVRCKDVHRTSSILAVM